MSLEKLYWEKHSVWMQDETSTYISNLGVWNEKKHFLTSPFFPIQVSNLSNRLLNPWNKYELTKMLKYNEWIIRNKLVIIISHNILSPEIFVSISKDYTFKNYVNFCILLVNVETKNDIIYQYSKVAKLPNDEQGTKMSYVFR